MALRLEEDSGAVKVARNFAEIASSSVLVGSRAGLRDHLLRSTLLAFFSGCGSRNTDFAARRSLRRGIQESSGTLETRAHGAVCSSGSSNGRRSESAKDTRAVGVVGVAGALQSAAGGGNWAIRVAQPAVCKCRLQGAHHPPGRGSSQPPRGESRYRPPDRAQQQS